MSGPRRRQLDTRSWREAMRRFYDASTTVSESCARVGLSDFLLCMFASEQGPSLHQRYPASSLLHPHPPSAAADSTPHEVVVDQRPVDHHRGLSLLHDRSFAMRAATTTPVDAAPAHHAHFGAVAHLPSPLLWRGGIRTRRLFEACSVVTHVAAPMARWPPTRPFQEVLQPIRYLLERSLSFRPERELAGSDWARPRPHRHRRINRAVARHTQEQSGACAAVHSDGQEELAVLLDRSRRQARRHRAKLDHGLHAARRRRLHLLRRRSATRGPASGQPRSRTHAAAVEATLRRAAAALGLARDTLMRNNAGGLPATAEATHRVGLRG